MGDTRPRGFEWDDAKEAANIRKHGVDFDEAASFFEDDALKIHYDEGPHNEDRFVAIGWSHRARALFVVFCERGKDAEVIRIISAREASRRERGSLGRL
jgi:uncharacterized DUF497 family protein